MRAKLGMSFAEYKKAICACGHRATDHWTSNFQKLFDVKKIHDCAKKSCACIKFKSESPAKAE